MVELVLPRGYRLVSLDSVDSTNEEAWRLARAGSAQATLVIWAKAQTVGRGRQGRHWVSKPGNLYCSFLIPARWPTRRAPEIGFVATNAVAETVTAFLPPGCRVLCKWPNDVLVNGGKVAGILLENVTGNAPKADQLILGIGINLTHFPDETRYPATCLLDEGADEADIGTVLQDLAGRVAAGLAAWERKGFGDVRRSWLSRAAGLGAPIEIRLPSETLRGVFRDLDSDGALVLATGESERRVTVGDVSLASPPPI